MNQPEQIPAEEIINKALNGERLAILELIALLDLSPGSLVTYRLMGAANKVTRREAGGEGMVGAQIGLNVEPCSMNCEFCSFGGKHSKIRSGYRLSREKVAQKTVDFLNAGINYISLMATADYPFDLYLRSSEAARDVMPPQMMLSANIGDFGPEQAQALRALGFGRVYHPIRLDEGSKTRIDPSQRIRTLEAAAAENLEIAYCIEPIGPEHTSRHIAEMIDFSLRFRPTTAAVMRRIPIEGTIFEHAGIVPEIRMAQIMAVLRLAYAHTDTKTFYIHEPSMLGLISGANLICAETAANPREVDETTGSARGFSVSKCREYLENAGYGWRREPNFPGSWFAGYAPMH
jgi:biotin synthase